MRPLQGHVVLVAGATRGAGRGIAVQLGAVGATVYVTGRSSRRTGPSDLRRPETIEETAEQVTAAGGRGVAVRVDHTQPAEVEALLRNLAAAENGRLDILVNDVWGGDHLTHWGKPFWAVPIADTLTMLRRGIESHIITSRLAVPLMVERGRGLVIEVTDGASESYRGNLAYDLVKASVIRLALAQAAELRPHGVTALALTPGFLRSESVLDHFGVTEATWQDAVVDRLDLDDNGHAVDFSQLDRWSFRASETPAYIGRTVAALAADPDVARWSGQVLSSGRLAVEYGFTDIDGSHPDWERFFEIEMAPRLDTSRGILG